MLSKVKESDSPCRYSDAPEDRQDIMHDIGGRTISGFIGKVDYSFDRILPYKNDLTYDDETLYYLPAYTGSLSPFKAAFPSMDALTNAMRAKYGKYLPDDFNYSDNIGQITGIYRVIIIPNKKRTKK